MEMIHGASTLVRELQPTKEWQRNLRLISEESVERASLHPLEHHPISLRWLVDDDCQQADDVVMLRHVVRHRQLAKEISQV